MSSETTNLHLVKPADNETADIDVINGNMDIIDAAVAYETLTVTSDNNRVTVTSAARFGPVVFLTGTVTAGNGGFLESQLSGLPTPIGEVAVTFGRIDGTEPMTPNAKITTAKKFVYYCPDTMPYRKVWSCTYIS